jgi:hypothetical protein
MARRQFSIRASRSRHRVGARETYKISVNLRPRIHGTEGAAGPPARPLCGVEKIVQGLIETGRLEPRKKG